MQTPFKAVTLLAIVAIIGQSNAFQNTNKLLNSLNDLHTHTGTAMMCYTNMEAPRVRAKEFVSDTVGVYDGMTKLNARCSTINTVASAFLLIPGLNVFAAPVLGPLTTSITYLSRAISLAQTAAEPFINAFRDWEAPMHSANQVSIENTRLLSSVQTAANNGKSHVSMVAGEISQVACGQTRNNLLSNIESASGGVVSVSDAANAEIQRSDGYCVQVKGFFKYIDGKVDSAVTTSLSIAKTSIDVINSGFDPIQEYLDEVDKVLDTELCAADVQRLVGDQFVDDVVDTVEDAAETVVDEVKKVFKGWRKRRAAKRAANAKIVLKKRDLCITVRKILDSTTAVAGGYTAAAELLVREVFNKAMPAVPELTEELKNMAATLLPFDTSFDLQAKTNGMVLNPAPINNFLAIDFAQTFWETPSSSDVTGSSHTCSGETALMTV